MASIFDNLNQRISGLGLPGNLGLLTTGAGLLDGQNPLQAIQAGLGVYGSMTEDEERRRRKGALAKLGEQYANDPRLKAIIDADPDAGLSLIAQLEANKRAYRAPTLTTQRKNLAEALGYAPDSQEYRNILETGSSVGPSYGTKKAGDGFMYYTEGPNKGQRVFPDVTLPPAAAVSPIGKLAQDFQAGNITLDAYNAAIAKATNVPDTLLQQRVKLAEALNYAAGTPPYESILSTGKYEAPSAQSAIGKLVSDYDNGVIGVNAFDKGLAKLTNIPDTLVTQRKNLATELGFSAGTPQYIEVLTTGKYEGVQAQTELAKLKQDFDNNLITEGTYNNRVAKLATTPPPSANVKNYVADQDVTIGNQTYTAGTVFGVNQNDPDALGAVLEAGGRLAPTRTESTVTNTPANATAANTILSEATSAAATSVESSPTIDIVQAGGGDIGGVVTDVLNTAAGFFGTTFNATREEQKATVNAANNAIREPLVKALSRSGSVYTQKQIAQLLPSPNDGNEKFIQKAEALIPTLENEMRYQASIIATSTDAIEQQAAENSLQDLVKYTEGMKAAIRKYREDRPSGGVSAAQKRADEILRRSRD
jgi:hypothetical protein